MMAEPANIERAGTILVWPRSCSDQITMSGHVTSSFHLFDESKASAWLIASGTALISAVPAVFASQEIAIFNLFLALMAGLIGFFVLGRFASERLRLVRVPRGALSLWILALGVSWLMPAGKLSLSTAQVIVCCTTLLFSLSYRGSLVRFFLVALGGIFAASFRLAAPTTLHTDVHTDVHTNEWITPSAGIFSLAVGLGIFIILMRLTRSRRLVLNEVVVRSRELVVESKHKISMLSDMTQVARERLLGNLDRVGEHGRGLAEGQLFELPMETAAFNEIMGSLRKLFADFQQRGRQSGQINGPVRFVFFQPAAGYDEKSLIAVDLGAFLQGVEACLDLAFESLPEIGARKREGVVRLSVRFGLRVIEVSIEDNGRGLTSRNLAAELHINSLRSQVTKWGGRLDRISKLGVGGRTTMELPIVRQAPLNSRYRPTLRHRSQANVIDSFRESDRDLAQSPVDGGQRV